VHRAEELEGVLTVKIHRSVALLLVALGASAGLTPARADWLVTREGARVEVKGAWTVKGKVVTFTLPNGTLGSMRLADLDLEESGRATAAAAAKAAPAAPAPAKTAVLVLTDADVSHASETSAAPAAAATATAAPADTVTGAGVSVSAWDKEFSQADNGVVITGTARNNGKTIAAALNVNVRLYDEKGSLVSSAPATLSADVLEPGAAARFRALFPGVLEFSAVKFDLESTPISTEAPAEGTPPPSAN
jgi:hypothetical protein